jgi:hypothetical protein
MTRTLGLLVITLAGCGILPDYRDEPRPQSRPASRAASGQTSQATRPASRPDVTNLLQAPPDSTGWLPLELSLAGGTDLGGSLGDRGTDIYGLRLGLLGSEDRSAYGLDVHLGVGRTVAGGGGLAVALVGNSTLRDYYGIQVAGVVNGQTWGWERQSSLWGLQLSPLANMASSFYGAQVGGFNFAVRGHGAQIGVMNGLSHLEGISAAAFMSFAEGGHGVQIAPVTFCSRGLDGVQIGVFNIATYGFQLGLINWNKNGFLPVFPLFNF